MSVKLLLYCTKAKPRLFKSLNKNIFYHSESNLDFLSDYERENILNGKIVCECECDKVEKFDVPYPAYFWEVKDKLEHITRCSCLSLMNLHHYLGNANGYALHLSNVKVFDEPKDLNKYSKRLPNGDFQVLGNAPQNMMNVCKIKCLIEDYVLISIQPQHLCKILNGEKTIEVRRKILNSLKEVLGNENNS